MSKRPSAPTMDATGPSGSGGGGSSRETSGVVGAKGPSNANNMRVV